jgi:hypothetical protein
MRESHRTRHALLRGHCADSLPSEPHLDFDTSARFRISEPKQGLLYHPRGHICVRPVPVSSELKCKDFSAPCPDCGHQDVFFGVEAMEVCHGELSPIERMELDDERAAGIRVGRRG